MLGRPDQIQRRFRTTGRWGDDHAMDVVAAHELAESLVEIGELQQPSLRVDLERGDDLRVHTRPCKLLRDGART